MGGSTDKKGSDGWVVSFFYIFGDGTGHGVILGLDCCVYSDGQLGVTTVAPSLLLLVYSVTGRYIGPCSLGGILFAFPFLWEEEILVQRSCSGVLAILAILLSTYDWEAGLGRSVGQVPSC